MYIQTTPLCNRVQSSDVVRMGGVQMAMTGKHVVSE